jgi:hypothetical protein
MMMPKSPAAYEVRVIVIFAVLGLYVDVWDLRVIAMS